MAAEKALVDKWNCALRTTSVRVLGTVSESECRDIAHYCDSAGAVRFGDWSQLGGRAEQRKTDVPVGGQWLAACEHCRAAGISAGDDIAGHDDSDIVHLRIIRGRTATRRLYCRVLLRPAYSMDHQTMSDARRGH